MRHVEFDAADDRVVGEILLLEIDSDLCDKRGTFSSIKS